MFLPPSLVTRRKVAVYQPALHVFCSRVSFVIILSFSLSLNTLAWCSHLKPVAMFTFRRKNNKKRTDNGPQFIRASPSLPDLSAHSIQWPESLVDVAELPAVKAQPAVPRTGASDGCSRTFRISLCFFMLIRQSRNLLVASLRAPFLPFMPHILPPRLTTGSRHILRVANQVKRTGTL